MNLDKAKNDIRENLLYSCLLYAFYRRLENQCGTVGDLPQLRKVDANQIGLTAFPVITELWGISITASGGAPATYYAFYVKAVKPNSYVEHADSTCHVSWIVPVNRT